jgi:hypothetical protein
MGKEKGNTEYRLKDQSVTVIGVKETKIWIIGELKLGLAPHFMQTLDSLRCYLDSTGSVCIPISSRICTCRAKRKKMWKEEAQLTSNAGPTQIGYYVFLHVISANWGRRFHITQILFFLGLRRVGKSHYSVPFCHQL